MPLANWRLTYLTCLVIACAFAIPSGAQFLPVPARSATSLSGQFIAQDWRPRGASNLAVALSTNSQFVCLDAALLSVSCERIKQYLYAQLGSASPWTGKIFVVLHTAESRDEPIVVTSERFQDLWQYRLDLPDVTERAKYVRAIVQVLLLEMANRSVPARSAELPLWLVEGFTRQLLASKELEIILPPPNRMANNIAINSAYFDSRRADSLHSQRDDPIALVRNVLRSNAFMTFEQLSWPVDDQLTGDQRELFCCSAQFFVLELLRIKDGQSCLRETLAELPQYYNWQLAFLHAFRDAFSQPLDVEKWWTLRLVNFTGTQAMQTWPIAESWRRFDEAVRPAVEIRAATNQLPGHAEVTLQTIIRDWDGESQKSELQNRLREFELLRWRLDPRIVPFLDEYRQVLETFLKESNPFGLTAALRKNAAIRNAREQAVRYLDFLDARRMAAAASPEPIADVKKTSSR